MNQLKHIIISFSVIFIILSDISFAQKAEFYAGAEVSYLSPIGTLRYRWVGTPGVSLYFGKKTSDKWIWVGKLEYFKFEQLNKNNLFVHDNEVINSKNYSFVLPLTNFANNLTVVGFSVNAKYNLIKTDIFDANVDAGFGIYNWKYKRKGYDSLTIDTVVAGTSNHILVFSQVPENTQQDWSGGFNLGLEFCFKLFEPVQITLAADYKNIVGELWPALTFEMENVATMQMLDFRAGLRVKL